MRRSEVFAAALSVLIAAAVVTAPTGLASPAPQPKLCTSSNAGSTCRSPGDVEINAPRRATEFYPIPQAGLNSRR